MTDNDTPKSRLLQFISYLSLTNQRFEVECKLSNGYVANMRRGVGGDALERISKRYPELSKTWLVLGNGKMLRENTDNNGINQSTLLVPVLPISAQGGSLDDFVMSVKKEDCEKIISPIKGMDFAITVSGESMSPEYPSGSRVLIKKIDNKAFIEWGRTYVLDTCNGTVIKKVMPSTAPDKLQCHSANKEFPPFEISLTDVYGVYRVHLLLTEK